jgi:hypothetical protein
MSHLKILVKVSAAEAEGPNNVSNRQVESWTVLAPARIGGKLRVSIGGQLEGGYDLDHADCIKLASCNIIYDNG